MDEGDREEMLLFIQECKQRDDHHEREQRKPDDHEHEQSQIYFDLQPQEIHPEGQQCDVIP